jgi:hypothetical protein
MKQIMKDVGYTTYVKKGKTERKAEWRAATNKTSVTRRKDSSLAAFRVEYDPTFGYRWKKSERH